MSDVEELVAGLRRGEPCGVSRCRDTTDPRACMCANAAHTIESLRASLARAEEERDALARAGEDLLFVVNAACGRGDYWHERRAMNLALRRVWRPQPLASATPPEEAE